MNDDLHPGVKLMLYLSLTGLLWWAGWEIFVWLARAAVGQ